MSKLKKVNISSLVDVFNNQRIPLSGKERENLNKIYPYYGAQGVVDFVDKYIFDGEYILVAEDGENLRSNNQNICNLVNTKFWVNNHAHIIRANKYNNTKYLYYNFNRINFEPYVTGSAQPKLNKENLLSIVTYVHDLPAQESIANILTSLDSKIELNNKINAELEAMAKLIYDYWFVQFDFPNEQGKPYKSFGGKMVWNEELKREVPEGWEVKSLGDIYSIDTEGLTPNVTPNFIFKHYSIPVFDKTKSYGLEPGNTIDSNKYIVKSNNLLISKLNPWFNRVVYDTYEKNMICSTEFVVLNCQNAQSKAFLYFIATSKHFIDYLVLNATGTSNSHKRVNPSNLIKYKIPFKKSFIKDFGDKVLPIVKQIQVNTKQNQQLAELRDWLLPMLMNGQVSVGEAEEKVK